MPEKTNKRECLRCAKKFVPQDRFQYLCGGCKMRDRYFPEYAPWEGKRITVYATPNEDYSNMLTWALIDWNGGTT